MNCAHEIVTMYDIVVLYLYMYVILTHVTVPYYPGNSLEDVKIKT